MPQEQKSSHLFLQNYLEIYKNAHTHTHMCVYSFRESTIMIVMALSLKPREPSRSPNYLFFQYMKKREEKMSPEVGAFNCYVNHQ